MTTQGESRSRPFVRRGMRVLLRVAVVVVAGGSALGLVPYFVVASMITGFLVGQFSSKDERAPSNVSGNFVWWKRRARGAFHRCIRTTDPLLPARVSVWFGSCSQAFRRRAGQELSEPFAPNSGPTATGMAPPAGGPRQATMSWRIGVLSRNASTACMRAR